MNLDVIGIISDCSYVITQVDSLRPIQPVYTADQGDAAPAPINVVIDKQSNEQQAGDDNALPSQPNPHPPNSVLLGLKEVNSKESREHRKMVVPQTTINHKSWLLVPLQRLPTVSSTLGRCRHGRVGNFKKVVQAKLTEGRWDYIRVDGITLTGFCRLV